MQLDKDYTEAPTSASPLSPASLRLAPISRLSTSQQKGGHGRTRQEQLEIAAYASELGATLLPGYAVTERASIFDRPTFLAALADAKLRHERGELDGMVFGSVDRLSRDPYDGAAVLRDALKAGLRVYFAAERLNAASLADQAAIVGALSASRAYVERMRRNTAPARAARALDGRIPNGQCPWPFDYDKAKGRASLNPERAAWVRRWAAILIEGGTVSDCLREMNAANVPAPKGGTWTSRATVTRILHSPAMVGRFESGYQRVVSASFFEKGKRQPGTPVLVYEDESCRVLSNETWARVQARLQENKALSARNVQRDYGPLRGLVRCGGCGLALAGDGKKRWPSFRCPRCRHSVGVGPLTAFMRDWARRVAASASLREKMLGRLLGPGSNKTLDRDIATTESQLAFESKKQARAIRMAVELGGAHEQTLKGVLATIEQTKARLVDDLAALKAERSDAAGRVTPEEAGTFVDDVVAGFQARLGADDVLRRQLVGLGLKVIVSWASGQSRIDLRRSSTLQRKPVSLDLGVVVQQAVSA